MTSNNEDALVEALEAIASTKYGVQGIYEDYSDHNERNYRELVYWRDLAQRYQARARAALTAHRNYKGE